MMAARLRQLQVRANISFVIPKEWMESPDEEPTITAMLAHASDQLQVDLWPVTRQHLAVTWLFLQALIYGLPAPVRGTL